MPSEQPSRISDLKNQLGQHGYVADSSLTATLVLGKALQRPVLLEGEAGVGKTDVAKSLALARNTRLIRLQCYEGLDAHSTLYEWNYQRQLLAIKLLEHDDRSTAEKEKDIFSEQYLLKRPLLEAITTSPPPVLLIDEIDRADEAFEAYLLEVLSDYQVSIPEFGTIRASSRPDVILTSNGTRELSDALRRRCLYHYVDYPDFNKEVKIIQARVPDAPLALARQVVEFVQSLRGLDLKKKPGIAETLDWISALLQLDLRTLDENGTERILDSLSALVKTHEDRARLTRPVIQKMVAAC
ncbi:AAA family ATPase [Pollutimonas thiosulfatoxidans]|uniref:ATPase n=1 Tax=Pollutimonas thiosulfatoxidans TaxID=2028345 RepID=A0A410GA10_9BURK|nr:MoxR family ATPase [Pollutimonas thiosulfatoxidans]QAA93101.1 ATPase [Pollutimonas thiosulfatoxidans]